MQKCIIAEVPDKINSFFSKKQFFQNIVDQPAETKPMKLKRRQTTIPPEPSRAERATRTDLALEQSELWHRDAGEAAQLPGVRVRASEHRGIRTTWVEVLDEQGSRALGKPVGSYVTLELGDLGLGGAAALTRAGRALAEALGSMMGLDGLAPVLVVGLGNEDVTPDALGPLVLRRLLITRHLQDGALHGLRPVSALQPGVLGSTGMESLEIVQSVVEKTRPSALIAVDALAARSPERLCTTVQLTDTGITPGSGVGSRRLRLNREQLGIPVFAVGSPTVIDAGALFAGRPGVGDMILTPRSIDSRVRQIAGVIGSGLNFSLHNRLTAAQFAQFVEASR